MPHRFRPSILLAAGLVLTCSLTAGAAPPKYTAQDLTMDQIQAAMRKATAALYRMEPVYTFLPAEYYGNANDWTHRYAEGHHALAVWALLAAGESYQNPALAKRLHWVLAADKPYVYERAMRMNMLGELPRERWYPWIHRDGLWLEQALTDQGNYDPQYVGGQATGYGDNAHGQYGVLGLFAAEQAGYQLANSRQSWALIDRYWREAQFPTPEDQPAGWGLYSPKRTLTRQQAGTTLSQRVSGPMTAGGVAVLCVTERMLYGPRMIQPGERHVSPELRKGLAWLDSNFRLDDPAEESDRYYYYWTIQRVGQATGYRSFNKVDWFRDVTARVLNEQLPDGTFAGDKGPLLATSFALLYLAHAHDPLAISKVRFDLSDSEGRLQETNWNNRPHDVWNFVDYASNLYEYSTTWQIVELRQPVYTLIESPLLWLAVNRAFTFDEEATRNLKAYLDAGGILVINPDDGYPAIRRSVEALCEQLYPQRELKRIPDDHPFFTLHQAVKGIPVEVLDNGVRPLVVVLGRDIGADLQRQDVGRSDAFRLLSNLYLYATGLNPRRSRLENHYTPPPVQPGVRPLQVARVTYEGNSDPEPGALEQLKNLLARDHGIDLKVDRVPGSGLGEQHKVAFLTTLGAGELTAEDAQAIGRWVKAGGTLWLDATGGSAEAGRHAEAMLRQILPEGEIVPLSNDHPIISGDGVLGGYNNRFVRFRNFYLRVMQAVNNVKLQGVFLDEVNGQRLAVVYSAEDLTCGLAGLDHWGIFGYSPQSARQLVVNGVLHAASDPFD